MVTTRASAAKRKDKVVRRAPTKRVGRGWKWGVGLGVGAMAALGGMGGLARGRFGIEQQLTRRQTDACSLLHGGMFSNACTRARENAHSFQQQAIRLQAARTRKQRAFKQEGFPMYHASTLANLTYRQPKHPSVERAGNWYSAANERTSTPQTRR